MRSYAVMNAAEKVFFGCFPENSAYDEVRGDESREGEYKVNI
jgi:hypothetical protein